MVHALHAVRRVLRPEGALISITPERFEARIAVVRRSHRVAAGRLINPSFDRYLLAAEAALDRVVRDGSFALEGRRRHRYHIRLRGPAELPEYIDLLGTPRPRVSPGTWPRLRTLWRSRPAGARLEITDGLVIAALRRSSSEPRR
jgi:hypothetical protein